jgi:hypothetical protein
LLSRPDRFGNIVQWYSFGVSIVLAGLLARTFQMPLRGQVVAAVVAATVLSFVFSLRAFTQGTHSRAARSAH